MDYFDRYRRRSQRSGKTAKEKKLNEIRRNFLKHWKESPTGFEVQATVPDEINISDETRTIKAIIGDITLNDKRVLDEKYLQVAHDEVMEIGCYILWQNSHWIVMFREHNTVESHKTFVIRRCNQFINHRYKNEIWKIPVSIENLTMYSDGLADSILHSIPDPKRHISMGSNPITRTLGLGHRVMLGGKTVFRITHFNDFEYNSAFTGSQGLIKALVLQTTVISNDDLENFVAWNEVEEYIENVVGEILGDDRITFSSSKKYRYNGDNTITWEIDSPLATVVTEDNQCTVKVVDDITKVGEKINLSAIDFETGKVLDTKEISIVGFI